MTDPFDLLPHYLRKRFVVRRLRERLRPRRRWAAPEGVRLRRPIFLIGFHKNATTSFGAWLGASGVRVQLFGGYARKNNLAARMFSNFSAGRPLLTGLDGCELYADLGYCDGQLYLEASRLFRVMHEDYPDAYFILNTRPVEDWIRSRRTHSKRRFAVRLACALGVGCDDVPGIERRLHSLHHQEVRAYFSGRNARFLEFDISSDPPSRVAEFLAPDYRLDPAGFGHRNATPAAIVAAQA